MMIRSILHMARTSKVGLDTDLLTRMAVSEQTPSAEATDEGFTSNFYPHTKPNVCSFAFALAFHKFGKRNAPTPSCPKIMT